MSTEIRVTAPNRVDLAGGTTDLYPLFLLMDGGCTVNAAVTVVSQATLRPLDGPGIRIVSDDLGKTVEGAGPDELPLDGPLGLLVRAVRVLPPPGPVEIVTRNQAPAGSGLGASSALLVALLVGLLKLRAEQMSSDKIIDLAANIETSAIGVPTGKQDYIAALYGGVSMLEFGHLGFQRQTAGEDTDAREPLERMIVLSYTGEGHFSGINNWEMTKAFIDKKGEVRDKLFRIRDLARQVGALIMGGKPGDAAELIDREWELRRTLAPGISTPRIDSIIAATRAAGALANKICGAGGGGCMITLTLPEHRAAVEKAIAEAGGSLLSFRIDRRGVVVDA